MNLFKFFILFFNSFGLSKSQIANTEKKNVLEKDKKAHFLFAENVTINISEERYAIWSGEEREHNIRCGNEYGNRVCLFNLKVKISGTPVRDLLEPSP